MKRSRWWSLGILAILALAFWVLTRGYFGPSALRPPDDTALDPEIRALALEHAERVDARRGDPQRRYELGLVYHANQLYGLAAACFVQTAAQNPQAPVIWYHLAHCRERLGDLEGATRAMAHAASLSDSYAPIHWRLAMWHSDVGDLAAARNASQRALEIDPDAVPAHLVLASIAVSEGSLNDAAAVIASNRLTEGRGASWAHRILLEIAQHRGDREAVMRYSRRAGDRGLFYALDPWLGALAPLRVGLAYRSRQAGRLVRAGRYEEAIPMLLALTLEAPLDPRTMNLLASCYLRTQRRGEAVQLFGRASLADPGNLSSYTNLVTALLSTQTPTPADLDQAEVAALRALELDVEAAAAHFVLGEVRRVQGRDEEALTAYRRAFALDGRSSTSLYRAGRILLKRGEWAAADKLYTAAVEREPEGGEAYAGRAIALVGQGRLDDAAADLERAADAAIPAVELLRVAQARFTNRQSTPEISTP
jgi:tetratricopeptide (TPR) repeat protein